jgi:hypothetical protein
MNDIFYIKDINDTTSAYKNYFKVECPSKQYLDDMTDDIKIIKKLDDSVPCYSQIYSGLEYIIDLTTPSVACTPPNTPSTIYTYRTYKFELGENTEMYITRAAQGVASQGIKLYWYNSEGEDIGSYITYETIYGTSTYNNTYIENFPTSGTYYVTIRQYYSNAWFNTNEILFTFDDAGTPPVEGELKKYKNIFTNNKKFSIIYNGEKFDFDYKADYSEIVTGQYKINSLIFKMPNNIPITNNTIYPIIFDENDTNSELTIDENDVNNNSNIGLFDENDNMTLNNFLSTLSYKNKHTL